MRGAAGRRSHGASKMTIGPELHVVSPATMSRAPEQSSADRRGVPTAYVPPPAFTFNRNVPSVFVINALSMNDACEPASDPTGNESSLVTANAGTLPVSIVKARVSAIATPATPDVYAAPVDVGGTSSTIGTRISSSVRGRNPYDNFGSAR